MERNHASPTPAEMEELLNGNAGFWSTKLSAAGALRGNWPIDWPRDETSTVYDLVKRLRQEEGRDRRAPTPSDPAELGRLGWASLLTRGPGNGTPMGSTDTCWDPAKRLHSHCDSQWGDYVRPVGWVVRVFDPGAPTGQACTWTVTGAIFTQGPVPGDFRSSAQTALRQKTATTKSADCREIRVIVPSLAADPADPRRTPVKGSAQIQRKSTDGQTTQVSVEPRDRLVIGLGDSFTSGEGNPERPARFNGETWSAIQHTPGGPTRLQSSGAASLPARNPNSTSPKTPDTRAQWTDRWCHRSVYSWQIRATLAVALRDLHQSVTVLPYGCSGAEILEGLLYGWNGPEYDLATDRKLHVIGSRAEIGLAYQEVCANYRPTNNLKLNPPSSQDETRPNFYSDALANARGYVARCSPTKTNIFKRSADALLLDIGINDVQFYKWVLGLILEGSIRDGASGFVPCVDAAQQPCDATTQKMFDQLHQRFQLLRNVFTTYLLPEFQIEPDRVIAAIYPPELSGCGAGAGEPVSGNVGLTVATEAPPLRLSALGSIRKPATARYWDLRWSGMALSWLRFGTRTTSNPSTTRASS